MSRPSPVKIDEGVTIGGGKLVLLAGPCVIESRDHTLRVAERVRRICDRLKMPVVFKASFDKANRQSADSFRGPGLEKGLAILSEVRSEWGMPIVSDIHEPAQAQPAGEVLDIIQIPAFLCRQTDLLVAAGQTGRCVNVKKGQFVSPEQMGDAVDKVRRTGNDRVLLTERGTFFGYGHMVNDMTAIDVMHRFTPVVFDASHSCQMPGGGGDHSGGRREFAPLLSRAAVAAGTDALFLEVHDNPPIARSDAATVWPIDQLESMLAGCIRVFDAVRG
ncbi:MAG: 3-deoxy-8-phosphooctulonate synthase [Phycisphaerae bacterium]|nr:3-deoxy-8-phosphooctulonate synthase [Phycisphaerae bacterium]